MYSVISRRVIAGGMLLLLFLAGISAYAQEAAAPEDLRKEITRAQLAVKIIKLLGHQKDTVSEFPFYRDVPKTHPAYADIEVARERDLITETELAIPAGLFKPEQPVTYAEVYRVLDRALVGKKPSPDFSRMLLAPFVDVDDLSDQLAPVAAKLVVGTVLNPDLDQQLTPGENITPEDLDKFLQRLSIRLSVVRFRLPPEPETFPELPVGEVLAVEPTSVILKEAIALGDTLYFALSQDTPDFAKGSRLRGKVVAKNSEDEYTVLINELKTTKGMYYRTQSNLRLVFPKRSGFFAPGDPLTLVTGK